MDTRTLCRLGGPDKFKEVIELLHSEVREKIPAQPFVRQFCSLSVFAALIPQSHRADSSDADGAPLLRRKSVEGSPLCFGSFTIELQCLGQVASPY